MSLLHFLKDPDFSQALVVTTMAETSFCKQIRICMQKDAVMKEHNAPRGISITLLQGSIRIELEEKQYELTTGDTLVLEARVNHSLYAYANSIIQLTLSQDDSARRVFSVLHP